MTTHESLGMRLTKLVLVASVQNAHALASLAVTTQTKSIYTVVKSLESISSKGVKSKLHISSLRYQISPQSTL